MFESEFIVFVSHLHLGLFKERKKKTGFSVWQCSSRQTNCCLVYKKSLDQVDRGSSCLQIAAIACSVHCCGALWINITTKQGDGEKARTLDGGMRKGGKVVGRARQSCQTSLGSRRRDQFRSMKDKRGIKLVQHLAVDV